MGKTIGILMAIGLLLLGVLLFRQSRPGPPAAVQETAATVRSSQTPRFAAHAASSVAQVTPTNRNSMTRYLDPDFTAPKLTAEQLQPFLEANHRNAGSLLAAARTGDDPKYLREAMEHFPKDPRVNYTAAFRGDFTPEERRQALENLKQFDPGNALGNYLVAADDFKSGRQAEALQELKAAAAKPGWQDYASDFAQNAEEAYRSAGYSEAEAKLRGASEVVLPDLGQFKSVGKSLVELAQSYQQAGDAASAQSALQTAMNLGGQVRGEAQAPLITTLVGMAIENMVFKAMDPAAPYGDSGQTVQDQINALANQRKEIRAITSQEDDLLSHMTDQEAANYFDRVKAFGAWPTMQWAAAKYGQPQSVTTR